MTQVAENVADYGRMACREGAAFDRMLAEMLEERGRVLECFKVDRVVITFDRDRFDFESAVRRHIVDKRLLPTDAPGLAGVQLSDLHRIVPRADQDLDKTQINKFTAGFYDASPELLEVYRRFVGEVVADHLGGGELFYQAVPTIRVHFPNQTGAFPRPFWHSDIMLGHPPRCVNVWLPVTEVAGNNSIRIIGRERSLEIMTSVDFDFDVFAQHTQTDEEFAKILMDASEPVDMKPGQCLIFDPRCIHATQYNDTDSTRVSIDVRVLAADEFHRGVGRRRLLFVPGQFYALEPAP